ncbi:Fic family protein [Zhaonella formicivorans]|uniref:Fic family protein n=1 Tax=Zhaonella formicivorans TaxID=2528593 RepID=UPI0010DD01FF|nr:Fic family protein [Zhaonella formicivorans]
MKPFKPRELPLADVIRQEEFIKELIAANKYLASYESAIKYSKINPDFFIKPLMRNEATLSSKIEGSRVTLDEALEHDEEDMVEHNETQEVLNYHKALIAGERLLEKLPLSSRLLKRLHEILLGNNVRGAGRAPGEFRRVQNFIGPPGSTLENASFVPPSPELVDGYMSNLDNYINLYDDFDELVKIAIIHAQFETIHPFLDGNGRIGRILIPLYLYYKKVTVKPYFFLSETLEKDKFKYYSLLNSVRFDDNWNGWIKFFLEAVIKQARLNIERVEKINELYERHLNLVRSLTKSHNAAIILDMMFYSPIFTVKSMSKLTHLDYQACNRIIKSFEEHNIIYSNGLKRNTKYYYYDLLDLIR